MCPDGCGKPYHQFYYCAAGAKREERRLEREFGVQPGHFKRLKEEMDRNGD
jgi:hypothetical protein